MFRKSHTLGLLIARLIIVFGLLVAALPAFPSASTRMEAEAHPMVETIPQNTYLATTGVWGYITKYYNGSWVLVTQYNAKTLTGRSPVQMCVVRWGSYLSGHCPHDQSLSSPWYYRELPPGEYLVSVKIGNDYYPCGTDPRGYVRVPISGTVRLDCRIR